MIVEIKDINGTIEKYFDVKGCDTDGNLISIGFKDGDCISYAIRNIIYVREHQYED